MVMMMMTKMRSKITRVDNDATVALIESGCKPSSILLALYLLMLDDYGNPIVVSHHGLADATKLSLNTIKTGLAELAKLKYFKTYHKQSNGDLTLVIDQGIFKHNLQLSKIDESIKI